LTIKAVGFRVVVKPDPVKEKTKGGIILATDEKLERAAISVGTVVEVGPIAFMAFKPYEGPWCQVGDKIAYAKYAGKWVADPEFPDDASKELLVMNDEDVVCRLEGQPDASTDGVETKQA
jgi:co-chaperonin GroES (HSP10)